MFILLDIGHCNRTAISENPSDILEVYLFRIVAIADYVTGDELPYKGDCGPGR